MKGEIILTEDPLLFLSNDDPDIMKTLDTQYTNLSVEKKKKVTALYDPDPAGDKDQEIIRIFRVNCIQGEDKDVISLSLF